MKRTLVLLSALAAIFIVSLGVTQWFLGNGMEDGVRGALAEPGDPVISQLMKWNLSSYERGFFSSSCRTEMEWDGFELSVPLRHEIHHGPVAFTPDGVKTGYAYVLTTLDREALDEEFKDRLDSVYLGKAPFTFRTLVSVSGQRITEVDVAPVDHTDGGLTIRFDGGTGRFEFSGTSAPIVKGSIRLSPLSMRDNRGGSLDRLQIGESNLELFVDANASSRVKATMGEVKIQQSEPANFSAEMSGLELTGDWTTLTGQQSGLVVGNSDAGISRLKLRSNGVGELSFNDLDFSSSSKVENGFVHTSLGYSVESIETDSEEDSAAPHLAPLEGGAKFGFSTSLPIEVAARLSEFSSSLRILSSADGEGPLTDSALEQQKRLGELLEASVRGISKGAGFAVELAVGNGEGSLDTNLKLTYEGSRPLTAQKTYLEILENIHLEFDARVPPVLLALFPQVFEQGSTVLTADAAGGAMSSVLLKGGELMINGEPSNLLEQLVSILMTEIFWDEIFMGMQSASGQEES